jgi:hypothetical protein
MTRSSNHDSQDHEELKKEIKDELKHEARRKKALGCGICSVLMLLLILTPLLLAAFIAAKTGFMDVPVFTKWFYRPTQPSRVVTRLAGYSGADVISTIPAKVDYDFTTDTARMVFSEKEITTILDDSLRSEGGQEALPFTVRSVQVAIDEGEAEVYLVTQQEARDVTIRATFVPRIEEGLLRLDSTEVILGSLKLGDTMSRFVFGLLGKRLEESVNEGLAQIGSLESIDLSGGKITAVIRPRNDTE